jgi:class 3 adenylate cyclase
MAAVGLSTPALDHMRRAVEFAAEMRDAVGRIGNEYEVNLSLSLGIGAGTVVTDVVHGEELLFHLWGEAVIQADHALDKASDGQIVVTQAVYDKLADSYQFTQLPAAHPIPLWALEKG